MPKLASLPHASPTNVTFMSSFSQGHLTPQPTPLFASHFPRLLCEVCTFTQAHTLTPCRHLSSPIPLLSFSKPPASAGLLHWLGLNLFHIFACESYFRLLEAQCLHYQEYISCQFIPRLNTTRVKESLFGRYEVQRKDLLIPPTTSDTPHLPTPKSPLHLKRALRRLVPFGWGLTKILTKGGIKENKCFIPLAHLKRHYAPQRPRGLLQHDERRCADRG